MILDWASSFETGKQVCMHGPNDVELIRMPNPEEKKTQNKQW